jgi:hypothetical protein
LLFHLFELQLIIVIGGFEIFLIQLLLQVTLLFVFFLYTISTKVSSVKVPSDRRRGLSALCGWQVPHEILLWFFQSCQFICFFDNNMPEQWTICFPDLNLKDQIIWFYKNSQPPAYLTPVFDTSSYFHCKFFSVKFSKCTQNFDIINPNCVCDIKILNIHSTRFYVIGVIGVWLSLLMSSYCYRDTSSMFSQQKILFGILLILLILSK